MRKTGTTCKKPATISRSLLHLYVRLSPPSLTQVDLHREYWTQVFDPMLHQFYDGYTPNPDVSCNKYIKFGEFFNRIKQAHTQSFLHKLCGIPTDKRWWVATGSLSFFATDKRSLRPRRSKYSNRPISPLPLKRPQQRPNILPVPNIPRGPITHSLSPGILHQRTSPKHGKRLVTHAHRPKTILPGPLFRRTLRTTFLRFFSNLSLPPENHLRPPRRWYQSR